MSLISRYGLPTKLLLTIFELLDTKDIYAKIGTSKLKVCRRNWIVP
jgi:hypothetical protein